MYAKNLADVVATGRSVASASHAELYESIKARGSVETADSSWLTGGLFAGDTTRLDVCSSELRQVLAAAAELTSEEALQTTVRRHLKAFVNCVSGGAIVLHDTHREPYLNRQKPDFTGTPSSTKLKGDVTPLTVVIIIELKVGTLVSGDTLGQLAKYGMEVAKARPVDGPVTVAVMNASHIRFLRVANYRATSLCVSESYSWSDDSLSGGVEKLKQYVLAGLEERQRLMEAPWQPDYVADEVLGCGISARALAARRGRDHAGPRVVIKVFDKGTLLTETDETAAARRDTSASPSKKAKKAKKQETSGATRRSARLYAPGPPVAMPVVDASTSSVGGDGSGGGSGGGGASGGGGSASASATHGGVVAKTGRGKCCTVLLSLALVVRRVVCCRL